MSSPSLKSRDECVSAHFSGHLAWCPQCRFGVRLSLGSLLVRRNMWRKLERRLTSSATERLARLDGREGETTIVDERADGGCDSGDGVFVRAGPAEGAGTGGCGGVNKMLLVGREEECLCEGVPSPFSSASVGAWAGEAALGAADEGADFEVVVVVEVEVMVAGGSVSFPFLEEISLSEGDGALRATGSGVWRVWDVSACSECRRRLL